MSPIMLVIAASVWSGRLPLWKRYRYGRSFGAKCPTTLQNEVDVLSLQIFHFQRMKGVDG